MLAWLDAGDGGSGSLRLLTINKKAFLDVMLTFPFPLTVVSMQIERMSHLNGLAFFHSAAATF